VPPPPFMDVDKVFDVESITSYMDMLNDSSVDLAAGIDAFDGEDNVDDEEEEVKEYARKAIIKWLLSYSMFMINVYFSC
jgi:hypothetical protein